MEVVSMIPVLYKEDEQVFSHNGIGALYESLYCDVVEIENGSFTLELEYPVDGEWYSELKDFRIIQAKPNDIDDPHNFRIYEIVKSIDELSVYVRANTITNDLGNNLITKYVAKSQTAQLAMNGIKNNLVEPTNFDLVSDIQTVATSEWERINPLNAIVGTEGSLVDIWGGEIKRTNNAIHLFSRRGKDKVAIIRPGKNIEGLDMTVSTAGMITKIMPTYTYRPVEIPKYEMVTLQNGKTEKRRVTKTGNTNMPDEITIIGNTVTSKYAENYPMNKWASVDYGDDAELRETIDDFINSRLEEAENSDRVIDNSKFPSELKSFVTSELNKKAKQYFTHRNPGVDLPTVRISSDMLQLSDSPEWEEFKDLEQIGLTDTIEVWVEDYGIDVELRVTELRYDSLGERVVSFEAGSDKPPRQSVQEKKYADLTKSLNDYKTTVQNGVNNIMRNTADGLNRKFEGYTEPPAELSSEGDIWFKQIGDGKVEIWIHDGVYWQPLLSEDFVEQLVMDIAATQEELEEAKKQAKLDTDQALEDAKAHAEAEDARIRGELESEVNGAIALAEQAKAEVVTTANKAYEDAVAEADRLAEIRDNAITIEAGQITAGIIDAARLDAVNIVTSGLTANVIKSTHIETSTATVDKIFATDAMVNRLTAKTAFINSVKAVDIDAARITSGTISADRINATAIVTAGLTANVVKSTHISGDAALFDMLFSTASATDRLSARTAWIKTANLANASITDAKIANATISSAKIASLDVAKLSGNITNFMRTTWNGINTAIQIDPEYIRVHGTKGRKAYITPLAEFRSDAANGKYILMGNGRIQAYAPDVGALFILGSDLYNIKPEGQLGVMHRRRFAIGRYDRYSTDEGTPQLNPYIELGFWKDQSGYRDRNGMIRIHKPIMFEYRDNITGVGALNAEQLIVANGGYLRPDTSAGKYLSRLALGGSRGISFGVMTTSSYSRKAYIDNTHMYMFVTLSMEGRSITNVGSIGPRSERKYKKHIKPLKRVRDTIMSMNIYSYIKRGEFELGIMADEAPKEVLMPDEKSINLYSYASMLGKGLQEAFEEIDKIREVVAELKGVK